MNGRSFEPDANTGSTASFEQIVLLCEQFSGQWGQDERPDLSAFLKQVGGEAKETLLRNLLHYELQQRHCQGEHPSVEEYLAQLPQFADLVQSVFQESQETLTLHYDGDPEPAPRPMHPPASRLGEYLLVRELGRGAMGMVYEAVHRRGNRVALKTLPSVDADRLHQFKREFRSNSDINHPNLIALHELESDGSQWFFTMDLIEGQDFLSYVRPHGRLDAERLRAALGQLVEGMRALHSRHIVHRDLKPSNVMVARNGRVVLLDFGLVAELEQSGRGRDQVVGTPAYMAPEQAAGEPVTVACDWYAAGVMLYESLAGRPPFTGSARRVMKDKRQRNAPPVDQAGAFPDGLQDLAELCMRLLNRDPQVRTASLRAALPKSAAGEPASAAGTAARAGRLVGREPQLTSLRDALEEMQSRQEPITVLVSGQSGEGKTSLVESFLDSVRPRDATILTGRCYDREKVPFKALDSLIDAVADFLGQLPRDKAALLLPDDIGMLSQVFPELQRVEIVAEAAQLTPAELDERQTRQRAFEALRRLLKRIGIDRPLILFIDDLQWGDADSAEVLFQVMRPPGSPRLLLVGVFRQDESSGEPNADSPFARSQGRTSQVESPFLQRWRQLQQQHDVALRHREVLLGPLSDEQCIELTAELMGADGRRELVRQQALDFAREAGGNPFLLIELVSSHEEGESIGPLPMQDVLARKLARLPDDAERLLQVVAVSGRALALREASQAAGHAVPAVSTITRMRSERLLRLLGAGRYEDGVADGEQAVELLRKTGDLWLLNHADLNVAFNHFGLGNLSTAIGRARSAYERAMRIGEHTFAAGCVELLVTASGGRLPFEEMAGDIELSSDDILGISALLQAEGSWHRYHGRHEKAVEVLTEAWELPRRHHVINAYTVSAVVKLAAALRIHAESAAGGDATRLARRALQVARQASRLARFYPFAKPESLRELSLLRQAQGRLKKALRLATRSCAVAQQQKARHEHAQSLLVRGRLAQRLRLPEGDAQVEQAEATLAAFRQMIEGGEGVRGEGVRG